MDVILWNVGRNLNRAYRTCYAFGVRRLIACGPASQDGVIRGNLHSAAGRVVLVRAANLPDLSRCLALETHYRTPITDVSWDGVEGILIGGETSGLPRGITPMYQARIPTPGGLCLTVEAALAVALWEWTRRRVQET